MKKALSVTLSLVMIFTAFVSTAFAAEESGAQSALTSDLSGHWSENAARRWHEEGLIQGDQYGNMNLNSEVTYAEVATILQRMLGLHRTYSASQLSEKESNFWYSDAIAACQFYGMIQGDLNGEIDTNRALSRAEAFVIFARGFGIGPLENPDLSGFVDGETVPDWAAGYLAALAEEGYLSGMPTIGGRSLGWEDKIDRGSLLAFLNQTISDYLTEPGDYDLSSTDQIVLINGSLDGEIHLKGSAGKIIISHGNQSGISGTISTAKIILNSASQLTVEADSNVEELVCNDAAAIYNQGQVEQLTANVSHIKLSGQEPGQIILGTGVQSPENSSEQEKTERLEKSNSGSSGSVSSSSGSSGSGSSSSGSEPSSPSQNIPAQDQQVTVKFYPGEGASSVADWILVNANFAQTALPDPTKTGYHLAGWYGDADFGGEAYTFAGLKTAVEQASSGTTIELYAKWEPKNYTVKYNVEWSEAIPTYVFDGDYALPASPPSGNGQTFLGWFTAEEDGVQLTAENMKQEMRNMAVGCTQSTITLYARFSTPVLPETRTVTVTFQPNNGEETTSWTVIDGACTQTALPTPSKTGFAFNGWRDGDKKYTLEDLKTVLSAAADGTNLTLSADWTEKTLQVRLNTGGGSIKGRTWTKIDSEEGTWFYQLSPTWTEAENLTLPTPTFLGHAFQYWEKGETNYSAGQPLREFFTEEAVTALELTAEYSAVEYTVQFELGEHGKAGESVASKKFTLDDSDFDFPTPTEAEGYTFAGWYYDSAPIEALDNLHGIVLTLKNSTTITLTAHWN